MSLPTFLSLDVRRRQYCNAENRAFASPSMFPAPTVTSPLTSSILASLKPIILTPDLPQQNIVT